ncbi:hypothetical protein NLG97_g7017 [Lecanicillium saksenae]|uniref:Uncharacterized protein n=1 Tax=Lecanicillium saksenae TaxID=468837 RepID=A0ACC1QRU0_9HYPO|nr:hypothetical protein NLG97_g7017 [Lecanicillium saksenae]
MDLNTRLASEPARMRYACDYCKEKKINRELPKCAACRPWPSDCLYSRVVKHPRSDASRGLGTKWLNQPLRKAPTANAPNDVNGRLDRIEAAIQRLTDAIIQVQVQAAAPPETEISSNHSDKFRRSVSPLRTTAASSEPTSTPLSLNDASRQLLQLLEATTATTEQITASQTLNDLSRAINTVELREPGPGGEHAHATGGFFVPAKAVGYTLMGKFLQTMELASVMSIQPSDDLLSQVTFQPQYISQSAWIVIINFIYYIICSNDLELSSMADSFRNNVRIALDDAAIYLLPSDVSIQALLLLATHGDEFACPNLSWMLIGHACRQAQALELHKPRQAERSMQQRQLCLFWALFMVDKSCSIAFGRPCFLSIEVYANVELPSEEYLQEYRPHLGPSELTRQSTFGGHFFAQSILLAKINGEILDQTIAQRNNEPENKLQIRLDTCHQNCQKLLHDALNAELPECTLKQIEEMKLGIKTTQFQYINSSILLKQHQKSEASACLSLAREALSLLPDLVSNWTQVYNGPTWQLLYYPFTPFLIVFRQLTAVRDNATREMDLSLLRTTVSYFESMVTQVKALADIASKLAATAGAFTKLAESIGKQQPLSKLEYADGSSSAFTNTGAIALDGISIDDLLGFIPGEPQESSGRKRTFDTAFDWFSWESYVNLDSAYN